MPSFWKTGTPLALERHQRKVERKAADDAVKSEAKRRDGNRCRWPRCEFRNVAQVIDAAHVTQAAGMGGDPLLVRTERGDLMAICRLHHRMAPDNLHNCRLRIEPLTSLKTDGPCAFYATGADGVAYMVAQELTPGVYAKD